MRITSRPGWNRHGTVSRFNCHEDGRPNGCAAALVVVKRLFHVCSPNEVLVFSGGKSTVDGRAVGYRIVKGGTSTAASSTGVLRPDPLPRLRPRIPARLLLLSGVEGHLEFDS